MWGEKPLERGELRAVDKEAVPASGADAPHVGTDAVRDGDPAADNKTALGSRRCLAGSFSRAAWIRGCRQREEKEREKARMIHVGELGLPNDIEFSGERKRVRYNEGLGRELPARDGFVALGI